MHTYTLLIKKDDIVLEFKSYDNQIIETELAIWIDAAATAFNDPNNTNQKSHQNPATEIGVIDLDAPPPIIEKQPKPTKAPAIKEEIAKEEKEPYSYKISDATKEILQKAIHKPVKTMEEALKPEQQEQTPKNEEPAETITEQPQQPVVIEDSVSTQDFTSIFNQKIVKENSSTDKFAQLLSLQNIHNKFDCLIACAYHLVERENFERFTLKQINTLSKALLEEAIEHDTVKEALEKRFIKIVPDYTGIATTMEYTLTEQGIRYFNDQISQ